MTVPARRRQRERGVVIVLVAVSAAVIFLVAAIVIDLSMLRSDRRSDQRAVDAATTAGAIAVSQSGGPAGCDAALAYLEANLPGAASFTGVDCSVFPSDCVDGTTPVASTTGTSGDFTVTIVHPVPNLHDLMASSAIGLPRPAVLSADGGPCERLAVQLTLVRTPVFGGVAGADSLSTSVHAVAIATEPAGETRPLNLLVLERHDCEAVLVAGGGELVVASVDDPDDPLNPRPGVLAADSDGTLTPCDGVLHVKGTGALARADGPAGCPGELVPGTGQGCGLIELVAPGVPGDSDSCAGGNERPACWNENGTILPTPVPTNEIRTRAPIDHRYNCRASYASEPWFAEQDIVGCGLGARAYVDELEAYVDAVASDPAGAGWNVWGDDEAEPCTIEGNTAVTGVPTIGNWFVACDPFIVKRPFTFLGGNVIFNGDASVEGGTGHLTVNECAASSSCPASLSFTDGSNYNEAQFADTAAWVAFREGDGLHKAGGAALTINAASVVFLDRNCEASTSAGSTNRCILLAGGSGALSWSAPSEGPFDDLALWSEGTRQHDFAGQAALSLEGVFFVPSATAFYRGNGAQQQVSAQFISWRLRVEGGGALVVKPLVDRAVLFPEDSRTALIR